MNLWVQDVIFTALGSDLYARQPQGDDMMIYKGTTQINAMTAVKDTLPVGSGCSPVWWDVIVVGDNSLMFVVSLNLLPQVITPPIIGGKHDFIAVKAGASKFATYAVAVLEKDDRAMFVGHYDYNWNLDTDFIVRREDAWINWITTHFLEKV